MPTIKLRIGLFTLLAIPLVLAAEEKKPPSAGVFIVKNDEQVAKLKRAELVRIYLGKKTLWESGVKIAPAILPENNPATREFIEGVLKKSVGQYRAYWKRRLFSGAGTLPKSFRTFQEVVEFVATNPGAIGMVDRAPDDDRIKLLKIVE